VRVISEGDWSEIKRISKEKGYRSVIGSNPREDGGSRDKRGVEEGVAKEESI
jgi:hypothetical protein